MTITLLIEKSLKSCILHFVTLVLSFLIQEKEKGKELYPIIKKNRIITLTKQVDANHALLAKNLEVDSPMTIELEKQLGKKKFDVSSFELSKKFGVKVLF
jgi:hypothetical protein